MFHKIKSFKLGKLNVGFDHKPILIGEISANHNGKIENVFKIIDQAKQNSVDAIKLQTFTPHSMTLNLNKKDFKINKGLWKGYNLLIYIKRHKLLSVGIKKYLIIVKKRKSNVLVLLLMRLQLIFLRV